MVGASPGELLKRLRLERAAPSLKAFSRSFRSAFGCSPSLFPATGDLPGGRYAVTTPVGSYEGLGNAWSQFLGKWAPDSGEHIDFERPGYEVYLNDCSVIPENQLLPRLYETLL